MRAQCKLIGLVAVAAMASPARAGSPVPLGAPVVAIAAGPSRLMVATPKDVLLLDRHGRVLRRLPLAPGTASPGRAVIADDPFATAAGLGSADDYDDAYDVDLDVEDAENVTGRWARGARRLRSRPATEPTRPTVVAVDERFGWWGTPDGLWRIDLDGAGATQVLHAQGSGVRALATSPDGRNVIVLSDGVVLRSLDGGNNFARQFPVAGSRAEVSITAAGTAFILDTSGVRRLAIDSTTPEPLGLAMITGIASCGAQTLLVAAGAILVMEDSRNQPTPVLGDTLAGGALRLACSRNGHLWAALGANLWMSQDQGRSSVVLPVQPATTAMAATEDGVWLATSFGLWFEPVQPPAIASATPARHLPPEPGLATIRDAPWWLFVLPRIDIGFVSAQSSRQRDQRVFALLTFTFDRNSARALERHSLLARLAAAQRDRTPSWALTSSDEGSLSEQSEPLFRSQETSP